MTVAAWIMLIVTWSVVLGFTGRFLWLAMHRGGGDDDGDDG